jgi:hypothetical protein
MTELRRVKGPPSGSDRTVWRLVALVVTGILIAVVKPWGGAPVAPAAPVEPSLAAAPTSVPSVTPAGNGPLSDFLTFGTNEPPPGWELWPAGNLASFLFAMRIDMAPASTLEPSPATSGQASGASQPSGPVIPIPGTAIPTNWPTIRIPSGSRMDLLGINHPVANSVDLVLFEKLDDPTGSTIQAVTATSPWPTHFAVLGVMPHDAKAMEPWPPGQYLIVLRIGPDGVTRSLAIVIERGADASPSPVPQPGGS